MGEKVRERTDKDGGKVASEGEKDGRAAADCERLERDVAREVERELIRDEEIDERE